MTPTRHVAPPQIKRVLGTGFDPSRLPVGEGYNDADLYDPYSHLTDCGATTGSYGYIKEPFRKQIAVRLGDARRGQDMSSTFFTFSNAGRFDPSDALVGDLHDPESLEKIAVMEMSLRSSAADDDEDEYDNEAEEEMDELFALRAIGLHGMQNEADDMDDDDGQFEDLGDDGQSVHVGLDNENDGYDDDDKLDPGAARGGVDDSERAPTLEDKTRLSHDIYKLKSEELGELVWKLETRCPQAIVYNKQQPDEVEINMDAIEPGTFHEARRCRSGADGGARKNQPF